MISQGWLRTILGVAILASFMLACQFINSRFGLVENDAGKDIETGIPTPSNQPTPLVTEQVPALQISEKDELLDLISGLEWRSEGGYTQGLPQVSHDMVVSATIMLNAQDIAPPKSCLERPDCRQIVAIAIPDEIEGVLCASTETVLGKEYCSWVNFSQAAKFRTRPKLVDMHPSEWNYIPVLEIISSSDTPCAQSEFRCEIDNTCWASFDSYCRLCVGMDKERCACQSTLGKLTDGSDCQYWMSGDVIFSGKCQVGVCK